MWTDRARSWRKKGKRAVSPIIATILLVAITVVLAAVLYILISGLTKGPGNTPLGTAFGFGAPTAFTGTGKQYCAANDICYSIGLSAASAGVQTGSLNFQMKTPSGVVVATPTHMQLESISGAGLGIYTFSTAAWDNSTVSVTTVNTLILDTGAAASVSGDVLYALGVGSYSGSVTTNLP
jgi:flagellin-like protein